MTVGYPPRRAARASRRGVPAREPTARRLRVPCHPSATSRRDPRSRRRIDGDALAARRRRKRLLAVPVDAAAGRVEVERRRRTRPTTPASASSRSGVPRWRPAPVEDRPVAQRSWAGRRRAPSTCAVALPRRPAVLVGERERVTRTEAMPGPAASGRARRRRASVDRRPGRQYAAMSSTTAASRMLAAYRISKQMRPDERRDAQRRRQSTSSRGPQSFLASTLDARLRGRTPLSPGRRSVDRQSRLRRADRGRRTRRAPPSAGWPSR